MDQLTALALNDISSGFRRAPLWLNLGWNDLRTRYRRTLLGPLWLTLGTAITIGGLGIVWGAIFKLDVAVFIPYLAGGLITWQFLSAALTEGVATFTSHSAIITSIRMPLTVHALRVTARNLINFAHNLLVFVAVALIFSTEITVWTLAIVPGLVLVLLNYVWACLFLGIIGARFRDIEAFIGPVIFLVFLITPVMWKPSMLGRSQYLVDLNPFAHFLEIVRNPLLGSAPSLKAYGVVCGITLVGWVVTFLVFRRYRARVVFWL